MIRLQVKALALAAVAALIAAGCGGGSTSESAYGGGGEGSTASQGAYGGGGEGSTAAQGAYGGGAGGRSYGGGSTTAAATGTEAGGAATVSVASVPKLNNVLVDSEGFTLYDFHKDRGGKSACYGACAKSWPPLLTEGAPQPSNGAAAAKLGTARRNDGTMQVTYAGHPLYTFSEDTKPGDAKGNDVDAFGGEWYALTPQGTEPD
jgi:predicted lipoprotein with Yx(FWY)xxD motif